MENNTIFHNRYRLVRLLGRGNFSEVWLAKDTLTDAEVALKIYAPGVGLDDDGLNVFAREFSMVVNAHHNNLLRPLHYDSFERKPYLVLPYQDKGSTQRRIGLFSEADAWHMLRDVANGLACLHGMKKPVIHQDIKPANILQGDNGEYMLTDFGISSHCQSALRRSVSEAFTSAGTVAYMAPERFDKKGYVPIMASDIYSLGATVFELLMGDAPFGNDGGLRQRKGAEIPDLPDKFSQRLNKVIAQCLSIHPWERPTAEQLAATAQSALSGRKESRISYKKVAIPIIAMIALLAGIGVGAQYCNSHSGSNVPTSDTLVAKPDTIVETVEDSTSYLTDTVPEINVKVNEPQPPAPKPIEPSPTQPVIKTVQLGYGTYIGEVDELNQPNGTGQINVTSHTMICGSAGPDSWCYEVQTGWKISGTFYRGKISTAKFINEKGETVHTVVL